MQRILTVLSLVLLAASPLSAQAPAAADPPGTEIFLTTIDRTGPVPGLAAPRNVSQRPGYDNQPLFAPDGKSYFFTAIEDGQADLWIYDLAAAQKRRLTATKASEYSPTPLPGENALSFIHQDLDGRQLLGKISLGDSRRPEDPPAFPFPDIEPVGYHVWNGAGQAIFFVLGEPPTLQVAHPGPGAGKVLTRDIGRALKRVPGSEIDVAFVHKLSAEEWMIRRVHPMTGMISDLIRARPGREDFAFGPDGEIWMGDGGVLFRAAPGASEWTVVADWTEQGIKGITRLDVSPDGGGLVFVADE